MLKVAAILSLPLALAGMVASSSCLVVDVREDGPDGMHLVIPVPLFLAQAALTFAPEDGTRLSCPEVAEHLPAARQLIQALEGMPDAELVRVEDGDELVVVSKVNGDLEVEVDGPAEEMLVTLPLAVVDEILNSYDGETFKARDVIAALRGVSRTDLAYVRSRDEMVKIWIW